MLMLVLHHHSPVAAAIRQQQQQQQRQQQQQHQQYDSSNTTTFDNKQVAINNDAWLARATDRDGEIERWRDGDGLVSQFLTSDSPSRSLFPAPFSVFRR